MSVEQTERVLVMVGAYAGAGLVVALVFLAFGIKRVDHAARGASLAFRLAITPGLIALWPLVLLRWIGGGVINVPDEADQA